MHILLSGYPPFINQGKSGDNGLSLVAVEWKNVSLEGKAIIKTMMANEPSKRPSAEQCLLHPWFKS